jgi:hypothetical protein
LFLLYYLIYCIFVYTRGGYDDGGKYGARVNCIHATDLRDRVLTAAALPTTAHGQKFAGNSNVIGQVASCRPRPAASHGAPHTGEVNNYLWNNIMMYLYLYNTFLCYRFSYVEAISNRRTGLVCALLTYCNQTMFFVTIDCFYNGFL